jgi:S-DNA-T family DNA segregation ATPase FtsK/SpoIIIE
MAQPIEGVAVPQYRVPRLDEPAEDVAALEDHVPKVVIEPLELEPAEPKVAPVPLRPETAEAVPVVAERASGDSRWQLPPITLLERAPEVELGKADVERRARLIEEALASYGVEAKVIQINVGPTVTQFGVDPGWDRKYKEVKEKDRDGNVNVRLREVSKTRVKVERIASLSNDLALALATPNVKIEAPVPGKPIVGIEVPNTTAALVSLRDVIESAPFQRLRPKTKLPLALGKGVSGETVVADLTKMPHLLIAGSTGSGKSICLKSMILTLLLHATPEEVRLLMVDPKRVELVDFRNVPHLASPVVVDTEKAITTLKWLNREMDHRYDKLASVGARDIESYNRNPRVREPFPYLVLIVDELAELMAAAPDEVERGVCRLAQLARATGIHLVLATQRPSVDVVTGLIKANFPARISFAVASQFDSRTILDSAGAEKLLGRGDVLFLPADAPKPKRVQGSFISEHEIERVVSFWISQRGGPTYAPQLAEDMAKESAPARDEDPLLAKARELASEHGRLSTSFLQRRLGVGYPKAARLMDMLEEEGTVSTGEPGKSREVLRGERERGE